MCITEYVPPMYIRKPNNETIIMKQVYIMKQSQSKISYKKA